MREPGSLRPLNAADSTEGNGPPVPQVRTGGGDGPCLRGVGGSDDEEPGQSAGLGADVAWLSQYVAARRVYETGSRIQGSVQGLLLTASNRNNHRYHRKGTS